MLYNIHYSVITYLNDPLWKYLNLNNKKYSSAYDVYINFSLNIFSYLIFSINNYDTKPAYISDIPNCNFNSLLFVLLGT